MYFVYSIQSRTRPEHYYIGITEDIDRRLTEHNNEKSVHSNRFKPWELVFYVACVDKDKVLLFEAYLKTGAGRSFCKRHFWLVDFLCHLPFLQILQEILTKTSGYIRYRLGINFLFAERV